MRRFAVVVSLFLWVSAAYAQFESCSPLQLTSGNTRVMAPQFSDDGRRVVFASGSDITGQNADRSWEIFLLDRNANNAVTQIDSWPGPLDGNDIAGISGDGKWIAYRHTEGANFYSIRLYEVATRAITNITPVSGAVFGPSLNYDGTRIVWQDFAGSDKVQMYNRTTGQTTTLQTLAQLPSISSDGSVVAYQKGFPPNMTVYVKSIATGVETQIGNSGGGYNPRPRISRDGQSVTWAYSTNGNPQENGVKIYNMQTGATESIFAASGSYWTQMPDVSNGGAYVAFNSNDDPLGTNADHSSEVFVYNVASHSLFQLTHGSNPNQYSWLATFAANGELGFVSPLNLTGQNALGTDQLYVACGGNVPPVARAGADVTMATSGGVCSANVTLSGSASSDANGDPLTYSWSAPFNSTGVTASKSLAPGVYNVTLTVTDGRGGTANDLVVVTVVDGEPPAFTSVPSPITATTHDPTGAVVSVPTAAATDACGSATITSDAPAKFPLNTTTIHFKAKDAKGNEATASTTVTVNMVNATPVAHVDDVTVKTTDHCTAHVTLTANGSTDADGDALTYSWSAPFSGSGPVATADLAAGFYTVTLTVDDGHGGIAMDDANITVLDGEPPFFTSTIAPITVNTHEAVAQSVIVPLPTASDSCGTGAATVTSDAPATFPVGTTTVHFTARDAIGNSATSSTTVTVNVVNQPPVASIVLVSRVPGFCGENLVLNATATDADGDPLTFEWVNTQTTTPDIHVILHPGPVTISVIVRDGHGGSTTASYATTIFDVSPPNLNPNLGNIVVQTHDPNGTAVTLPPVTATDGCGGPVTITNDAPAIFPIGKTLVTYTATDSLGNSVSHDRLVTVEFVNAPPVAKAAAPAVVDAIDCTGSIALDGSQSSDPDGDALTYTWSGSFGTVTGVKPVVALSVGTHVIHLEVADPFGGKASTDISVTVRDVTAPVVNSAKPSSDSLWPPDHRMVPITVTVDLTESCGSASCKIASVTSNEPDNGLGDGDTPNDITITGALTVSLRAERSGKGNGRIYTINLVCSDEAGNQTRKSVEVKVPKNASGK